MVSEAQDSWVDQLDVEADHSFNSFRLWSRHQYWTAKTWWRETTDVVILNSPWLRRETGRSLRIMWVIVHILWWSVHYPRLHRMWKVPRLYAMFGVAALLVLIGICLNCRDRRESLLRSSVLCIGLLVSSILQTALYEDYHVEHSIVHVIVIFCHCNVHPSCVLCALVIGACYNFRNLNYFSRFVKLTDGLRFAETLWMQVFEVVLGIAFSWDFTTRVKAVASGLLFGGSSNDIEKEVWESPLVGRAGRKWCWALAVNNWLLWMTVMVAKSMMKEKIPSRAANGLLENNLPIGSSVLPSLSMASCLILLHDRCPIWVADTIFAVFCCLPSFLITMDTRLVGLAIKSASAAFLTRWIRELCTLSVLSSCVSVQIMIQAGCHSYICLFFSCVLNFSVVALSMAFDQFWWNTKMSWCYAHLVNPWISCMMVWMLVASHSIDFFRRIKAIREGIKRSLENAASQSLLLGRRDEGYVTVELPTFPAPVDLENPEEESDPSDGNEEPAIRTSSKTSASNVAVAVVRHAERADASSAFDHWCTSEDAATFPWDPPITQKGFEQTQSLALDLEQKHPDFKVIISSPFLRCLQTAMVLAEHFDADVLVDNELGEAMTTEVFESEPPLPPRPWTKVISALKLNFNTNRLKAGRSMGKTPPWPESPQRARLRYANRFLDYLRRARHTKKSCLLVTHGHMVQVCATILPATASRKIVRVDYAAAVLAVCHRAAAVQVQNLPDKLEHKSLSFHLKPDRRPSEIETDRQSQLQEGNELMHEARLKYWDVWLQNVHTVSSSAPQHVPQVLQQLQFQESLGRSWQDVVRLLGVLPPPEEFGSVANQPPNRSRSFSLDSFDCMTTSSLAMYQNPDMIPNSPRTAEMASDGKDMPRMTVKAFKESKKVELSLSSSSLAARRARKPPESEVAEPSEQTGSDVALGSTKNAPDEDLFLTL